MIGVGTAGCDPVRKAANHRSTLAIVDERVHEAVAGAGVAHEAVYVVHGPGGVQLNPKKSDRVTFAAGDRVVVIADS
jgi:hypothetical protein